MRGYIDYKIVLFAMALDVYNMKNLIESNIDNE
jgi:hypothetical protein